MLTHTMRTFFALATAFVLSVSAHAQFEIQDSHTTTSLRGIHSIGNGVAWASGTEGTVLRTTDDGKTWQHCATPPNADKLDFRGIQAFDRSTAIVMSSGKGDLSRLYKTTDACRTWRLVFTNPDKDGFFDAMQFQPGTHYRAGRRGWLLGDPVDHHFVLMATFDSGEHWQPVHQSGLAEPTGGGGAFAASNSLLLLGLPLYFAAAQGWFYEGASDCTMGLVQEHPASCLTLFNFSRQQLPIAHGNETSGIFSIAANNDTVLAVGGDFRLPGQPQGTAAVSSDRGLHWHAAQTPPHGYRSAVAYEPTTKTWITVGPNGTDISRDDGRNWTPLKPTKEDAPDADKNWNALSLPFVVGPNGRIGKLRPTALNP